MMAHSDYEARRAVSNTSPALDLYSRRLQKIDSENAFKLGPHIARLESEGRSVVRLNLGEPDFNVPGYILEEAKRQLDLGNTHYCDPQGVLSFREAIVEPWHERETLQFLLSASSFFQAQVDGLLYFSHQEPVDPSDHPRR